jgi:hypothetical protein
MAAGGTVRQIELRFLQAQCRQLGWSSVCAAFTGISIAISTLWVHARRRIDRPAIGPHFLVPGFAQQLVGHPDQGRTLGPRFARLRGEDRCHRAGFPQFLGESLAVPCVSAWVSAMIGLRVPSTEFNEIKGLKESRRRRSGSIFDQHSHAHFPAVKELAGFDFEAQPSIDPKQIRDLAASR